MRKPTPRDERPYDFTPLTKLEKEKLPPLPQDRLGENAGTNRLMISATEGSTYSSGGAFSYDALIAGIIKSNWVRPSRAVVGENPRPVEVAIRIELDGKITRAKIANSSGIRLLDDSAMKAIERSSPLPIGLPSYITSRYYDVTIVFQITDEV